ncbi:MAG: CRISPR system precrRNA processing endoribonuclease RAMP protein Cas6 [Syntrophaceae bacterium]|nr:CRISPR system precrRNA processing endoribonuclease RAMP protein Cas6 [Syntrophaceae bacterium]
MIEKLSLSVYRFTLLPLDVIRMPRLNKGNILRGAFGSSLKELVCAGDRSVGCEACILNQRCAYNLIFNPSGLIDVKRLRNLPRGYVLKPPLSEETEYDSSFPLTFDMVLIGDRIKYLPYVIVPLIELGRAGIGLNRGKFRLRSIEVIKDGSAIPIYDPTDNMVKNIDGTISGKELIEKAKTMDGESIALRFLTPTRIRYNPTGEKGKSIVLRTPEFHHILRRLRDRVNALLVAYCGGPIDADFKEIAERGMAVRKTASDLKWIEIKRRSRTQSSEHDQSGFVGRVTFAGDLAEFLPLLLSGEYVHVGEDTVFGNGWYRIESGRSK